LPFQSSDGLLQPVVKNGLVSAEAPSSHDGPTRALSPPISITNSYYHYYWYPMTVCFSFQNSTWVC